MNVKIITSLSEQQIGQLLVLYKNEFWCKQRKLEDVKKMLANTDVALAATDENENLIGFIRVLTDYTYKATIYDLIVHTDFRGRQLGKLLMDKVINHPDLKDVEHFGLYCLPSMHEFYQRWGFTTDVGEITLMRRTHSSS